MRPRSMGPWKTKEVGSSFYTSSDWMGDSTLEGAIIATVRNPVLIHQVLSCHWRSILNVWHSPGRCYQSMDCQQICTAPKYNDVSMQMFCDRK